MDKLVARVKQLFKAAPSMIQLFKNELSGLNLPPEPILTQCETWINAVLYYCESIQGIHHVGPMLWDYSIEKMRSVFKKQKNIWSKPTLKAIWHK